LNKTALGVFEDWIKEEVQYGEVHITVKVVDSKIKEVELIQGGVIRRFREEVK